MACRVTTISYCVYSLGLMELFHYIQEQISLSDRTLTVLTSLHMCRYLLQSGKALQTHFRNAHRKHIVCLKLASLYIRLQAGCPQEIPVNVMDLDGDEIRCRYEKTGLGEFMQLNEVSHVFL